MTTIVTQARPVSIDVTTATRLQLEQGCNEPIGSVGFSLTSGAYVDETTVTDRSYEAAFRSMPAGHVTAKQTSTNDYDTAGVYCRVQKQGKGVTRSKRVPVSADLSIAHPVNDGQWLKCEWYFANTPDGTVTVTKWQCPEPIPASQDRAQYQSKCTQTRDGVDFTVTGIASSSTQTTANGGKAQWTGVQPGLVTVTEKVPDGYGEPVVFCTGPKMNRNFAVVNGTIEHELLEGGYLTCD